MIRSETTIRVRYAETDAMGFVHHANYLTWFELARIEMLDALDMPYSELEKAGYFLPVLAATLKYRQPARFDDRVRVVCFIRDKPGLRIHMNYEVFRDKSLLCTGSTEHAFINGSGKPVRPPKHFIETFTRAMEAGSRLPG